MSTSNLHRIRLLYGIFAAIMLACLALFFLNVFSSDDPSVFRQAERQLEGRKQYAMGVTDLPVVPYDTLHTSHVTGVEKGLDVTARATRFDIVVATDNPSLVKSPYMTWAFSLQIVSVVSVLVIFVFVVVLLVRFYRSFREGKPFQRRVVGVLRVIGVMMLLMTLSADCSVFLEREAAFRLLAASDWVPQHHFTIHFTRIFFAIVILFVGELLHIGYDMQQEQDLTI